VSLARAKKTIVWDLDDTLNDLMGAWLGWYHQRNPTQRFVPFADLHENPPVRLLGVSEETYLASLDAFRLSIEGRSLSPVPAVIQWFEAQGFSYQHHVLTARPVATVSVAAEWVFAHFGRWVRHFHFVPARRTTENIPDQGEAKSDAIARLGGADFFIDDCPENINAARTVVRKCVLVPKPWNDGVGTIVDVLASLIAP